MGITEKDIQRAAEAYAKEQDCAYIDMLGFVAGAKWLLEQISKTEQPLYDYRRDYPHDNI